MLRPLVEWAPKSAEVPARFGVPVRKGLPSSRGVSPVAFGAAGELWVGCNEGVVRIRDPLADAEAEAFGIPTDVDGDRLEAQSLAPRGPHGRLAVGSSSGHVAVSAPDDPRRMTALPIRENPTEAGIMPFLAWTASGAVAASVHLTCDVVALDPETGRDVWRRTEQVARYPAASSNGRFILLPWAEGEAAAEVLDASTGKTLARLGHSDSGRVYGAIDDSGRWVIMGRYDAELSIWDTTSNAGATVTMMSEGGQVQPMGLVFLPSSTHCVVASSNAVWILDVPGRRWLASFTLPGDERFATFVPQGDLAVSPDGMRIAVRLERGGGVLVLRVERTP